MNKLFIILILSALSFEGMAQSRRDLTPSKRRQAYGKRDFGSYKPYGIQLSFGGIMLDSKRNNGWVESSPDAASRYRYNYSAPNGFGGFLELGMAHFPEKGLVIPIGDKKIRLISYWDWGLGVKFYGGQENFKIEYLDFEKNVISSQSATASFQHLLPYARLAAHHNFYFKSGHFIDLGLGTNFDYRVQSDSYNYKPDFINEPQRFSKEFFAQMNLSLGFGFKVRRGFYIIPSVGTPILGFYEWNQGKPHLNWFSSTYRPYEARLKFIWLFKDKTKDCNSGTEEDQKRNKEYMQNR